MPALSKKQQKFMGIVRSIQKGEQPASKFSKDAQDVAKDMKKKDVKKFASTKHKGLPMKKEILGKLKEMIKQELSEYTYGVGDVVKDVNPSCPHHGAEGKVKSVNPRSVVFVVTNKGQNFKPGQTLEKSHDQMKKMNENKVYKVGDTVSLLSFDRRERGKAKVKGVTKSRANKFGIKNHYVTNKGTFTDMEVEGTEAFKLRFKGNTEKQVTKAMNSPYGVILPEQSVNEMSAKTKKIISKLGKKEKEMFTDMVDMLGFDQVMADYKKDKKAFKQALKDMSEGVIQEKFSVNSSKEYFDNLDQAIGLIIRQANNLKGALGKHPIKRNINKLKAVQTMLKRGLAPAFYSHEKERRVEERFKGVDITLLKKKLQDGKFKSAVEYSLIPAIDTRSYDSNSFYFLKNDYPREEKLRKRLLDVLYDLRNKMDKAQLENINESMNPSAIKKMRDEFEKTGQLPPHLKKFALDLKILKKKHKVKNIVVPGLEWMSDMKEQSVNEDGHTDVASSKRKVMIMVDDSNKLLNKLNGMDKEDSLPSWWSDKITLSQNYLQKATNYLLNPVESVNEGKGVEKVLKMANDQSFGKLGGRTVDALSAGLFKGVYEKAPQNAKDKINKMNEKQLYVFMTKLWSKFGNQVRIG